MGRKNYGGCGFFSCVSVSDNEQVELPIASPSTETVSNEEQVGLPSASSSTQTVSILINAIREDAETVKPELDALIHKLSVLFEVIETPKELQKETKTPISAGFSKSKDLLLETVRFICSRNDVLPAHEASQVAQDVVQGLGQAHWVTLCFLLVSYILDGFEIPPNRDGCWPLFKQMYDLAVDIKKLTGWEGLAQAGTELIVEGSLICCSRFFSTSVDKDELLRFEEKILHFHERMIRRMPMWICSRLLCHKVCGFAVGIDEPFNNVTKLLQWEREERAVAVILHGFGGIGKTTLADAVFARYYVKDCKYSVVRLDSYPDIRNSEIVELQKNFLRDLRGTEEGRTSQGTEGDEMVDFIGFQDGRRKIGDLLKKEVAFLYIDNVVDSESFGKLLPTWILKDAKKLRLLITTRNINVLNRLGYIKREVHKMQPLPHDLRKRFLMEEIKMCSGPDDINMQITDGELDKLAMISDGVPKLLEVMIGFILSEPDKIRESYDRVIKDSEKFTGDAFSDIDKYIFAYDGLPPECKNPFLDICYFFKGWEWETVANIVGESELDALESRALVSKDKDMISLHDVILKIGKEKAKDPGVDSYTRFDFTNATAPQIKDFFEKDMEDLKLVKGLWFGDQECKIPVDSLNPMLNSLRIFGHKMVLEEGQCEKTFDKLIFYKGETPQFPFKWSRLKNIRFLSYRPQNLTLLQEIPTPNLKHIELDGSLCSVSEILSSDIQQLRALQVLRLINFHNLEKLPEDWGESLGKNLKELTLSHCTAMKQLPGSISQLTSLKILKLDNCCNLRRWPKHCESLSSSLQKLNMLNCRKLKSLPSCFAEALDSDSRLLFQDKGILSDSPQSDSDSNYESDED